MTARIRRSAYGTPRLRRTNVGVPSDVGEVLAAMTHGSATVPDPLHPLHRDDIGACELPLPRELEPVAFAMRQMRNSALQDARSAAEATACPRGLGSERSLPLSATLASSVARPTNDA